MGKIFHAVTRQTGYVEQCTLVNSIVYHSIGQEVNTMFGVQYVHCCKMLIARTYTYNFSCYFSRCVAAGIGSCQHRVGIAGFYHHHAEIVSVKHQFKRFKVCNAVALTFVSKISRITGTAVGLAVVTQIHNFNTVNIHT